MQVLWVVRIVFVLTALQASFTCFFFLLTFLWFIFFRKPTFILALSSIKVVCLRKLHFHRLRDAILWQIPSFKPCTLQSLTFLNQLLWFLIFLRSEKPSIFGRITIHTQAGRTSCSWRLNIDFYLIKVEEVLKTLLVNKTSDVALRVFSLPWGFSIFNPGEISQVAFRVKFKMILDNRNVLHLVVVVDMQKLEAFINLNNVRFLVWAIQFLSLEFKH